MNKKVLLLFTIAILSALLSGCTGGGGGGFDIVQFLQNPIVMVVLGCLIVYWMWKGTKK